MQGQQEQLQAFEPFTYQIDKDHLFFVRNQEDVIRTVFKIEYVKRQQVNTVLNCAKACFRSLGRSDDLLREEQDCLHSCFTKFNYASDLMFNQYAKISAQAMNRSRRQANHKMYEIEKVGDQIQHQLEVVNVKYDKKDQELLQNQQNQQQLQTQQQQQEHAGAVPVDQIVEVQQKEIDNSNISSSRVENEQVQMRDNDRIIHQENSASNLQTQSVPQI
eukprot:403373383